MNYSEVNLIKDQISKNLKINTNDINLYKRNDNKYYAELFYNGEVYSSDPDEDETLTMKDLLNLAMTQIPKGRKTFGKV